MKQRWSSFRGFQMAFFLARVSGSSFQQPPASLGGGGAGMSASCCEGAVSRYAAVMPTTVQSDSGKRERSSATSNRARQQDLEADLREEGQPNRQQVLEPVHQQPHGVDGEDLLPRKRAQPQLAGPGGPARAQLSHSGLGAGSARLLQRRRPDGGKAQAAPDEIRQLGDHGAE